MFPSYEYKSQRTYLWVDGKTLYPVTSHHASLGEICKAENDDMPRFFNLGEIRQTKS